MLVVMSYLLVLVDVSVLLPVVFGDEITMSWQRGDVCRPTGPRTG
jgi:hypothetical protein